MAINDSIAIGERRKVSNLEQLKKRLAAIANLQTDAIADDFRQPNVAREYEPFIRMLVLAKMAERVKAYEIRKEEGVEAAVRFLNECVDDPAAEISATGNPIVALPQSDDQPSFSYTLLKHCPDDQDGAQTIGNAIFAISAIANALVKVGGESADCLGLAGGLMLIGDKLVTALCNAPSLSQSDEIRKVARQMTQYVDAQDAGAAS